MTDAKWDGEMVDAMLADLFTDSVMLANDWKRAEEVVRRIIRAAFVNGVERAASYVADCEECGFNELAKSIRALAGGGNEDGK